MRAAFEQGRLGRATPMTPLHLYHAVQDKYPAIADVDKLVEKYRREGVDVTYRRFRFGGHMTAVVTGVPGSLRFLSERFSGSQATLETKAPWSRYSTAGGCRPPPNIRRIAAGRQSSE